MTQEIISRQENGVFTIQMNRPEKKNAITQNMYALMAEGFKRADREDAVRVVVLCGTQGIFTSGNDIGDFIARASSQSDEVPSASADFFEAVLSLRKPLIAAVQGFAIGIGTTMLLHCDMVYAGKSAVFSTPFVNLGLCPEFGSSYVLPSLVGRQRASELFMLGERISSEKACELGIVNRVIPDDTLMDEVIDIARRLARKSPAGLMATKQLIKGYTAQNVRNAIQTDGAMFAKLMSGPQAREAFEAFAAKREPDFSKF